jgi:hypothetical protein
MSDPAPDSVNAAASGTMPSVLTARRVMRTYAIVVHLPPFGQYPRRARRAGELALRQIVRERAAS